MGNKILETILDAEDIQDLDEADVIDAVADLVKGIQKLNLNEDGDKDDELETILHSIDAVEEAFENQDLDALKEAVEGLLPYAESDEDHSDEEDYSYSEEDDDTIQEDDDETELVFGESDDEVVQTALDTAEEAHDAVGELEDFDDIQEDDEPLAVIDQVEDKVEEAEDAVDSALEGDDLSQDDVEKLETAKEAIQEMKARVKVIRESVEAVLDDEDEIQQEEDEFDLESAVNEIVDDVIDDLDLDEDEPGAHGVGTLPVKLQDAEEMFETIKDNIDALDEDDEPVISMSDEEIKDIEDKIHALRDKEEAGTITEADGDEIDTLIARLSEEFEKVSDTSVEDAVVQEGINSMLRRMGFKEKDRKEFSSLFEFAVRSASRKVVKEAKGKMKTAVKKIARAVIKESKSQGKALLESHKDVYVDKLMIEESKKAQRIISEALSSNGFGARSIKPSAALEKRNRIIESLRKENKTLKESINAKKASALIDRLGKEMGLTLSQKAKLKESVKHEVPKTIGGMRILAESVFDIGITENRKSRPAKQNTAKRRILKESKVRMIPTGQKCGKQALSERELLAQQFAQLL